MDSQLAAPLLPPTRSKTQCRQRQINQQVMVHVMESHREAPAGLPPPLYSTSRLRVAGCHLAPGGRKLNRSSHTSMCSVPEHTASRASSLQTFFWGEWVRGVKKGDPSGMGTGWQQREGYDRR